MFKALYKLFGLCFLETRAGVSLLMVEAKSAEYIGGIITDVLGPVVR